MTASGVVNPADKSFTTLSALQRPQWSDVMSFPSSDTKYHFTSFFLALLLFRMTEMSMKDQDAWKRTTFAVLVSSVGFYGLNTYFGCNRART